MAQAVAVEAWAAQAVRVGDVVAALDQLRRRRLHHSLTRTAVMTLIAVVATDDGEEAANQAVHALGAHHPARVVMLCADPDQAAALDARAELYRIEGDRPGGPDRDGPDQGGPDRGGPDRGGPDPGGPDPGGPDPGGPGASGPDPGGPGANAYFEEITLSVGGQAALHLDSLVEPFTLADLPVVVWYVDALPDPADPLLAVADAVLVDSRDAEGLDLRRLLELASRRSVVDLSWMRLEPARSLLASLFDPPAFRPFAAAATSATVRGKPGPRHLLGGWLSAQLDLPPRQVELVDARHIGITIETALAGDLATFEIGRLESGHTLWAAATVASGPSPRQILPLPDDRLPAWLALALTRLHSDGIWERALSAAGSLGV
ncbi:MAG: glucose-6-phosphate dehydrogenase assembly protein OpcA [Acidimicrobiales bacterium]